MAESKKTIDRVKTRLKDETVDDTVLEELITTVSDRLCIRLGEDNLPSLFNSVCVDAVVKMYRRMYYEGIISEGTDGITTTFVDNILDEYSQEINDWKEKQSNTNGSQRVVKFL